MESKMRWEYKIKRSHCFSWIPKVDRTLHSFTDVDEVTWYIRFLWWRAMVSKIGKGVLRKYLRNGKEV